MTGQLDLKQLERRTWRSYHGDGLWDLQLGLLLLLAFLASVVQDERRFVAYGLMLVLAGLFYAAKRLITVPRLGLVKFGAERRARRRRVGIVLALVVLGTAALVVLTATGRGSWIQPNRTAFSLGLGLGIFLVFCLVAQWRDLPRAYFWGAAVAGAITAAELLDSALPFLGAGVLALAAGSVMLVRFLRKYPLPAAGELPGADTPAGPGGA